MSEVWILLIAAKYALLEGETYDVVRTDLSDFLKQSKRMTPRPHATLEFQLTEDALRRMNEI